MNPQYLIPMSPENAIAYFAKKKQLESWRWEDVWQEDHAKAFTVAKSVKMDILTDIQTALNSALKDGRTFNTFKKNLIPTLIKKGWLPKIDPALDPKNKKAVQKATARRLDTIYHTNIGIAYSAGNWKSLMDASSVLQYWKYVAIKDGQTRPSHLQLDGLIFHHTHLFWDTHYPPNGWRCRCSVVGITDKQAMESDKLVPINDGETLSEDIVISTATGEVQERAVFQYKNIQASTDAGWSYNPGQASFMLDLEQYDNALYTAYRADQYLDKFSYNKAVEAIPAAQKGSNADLILKKAAAGDNVQKRFFPVGVINNTLKKELGSAGHTVIISGDTLLTHLSSHPEITPDDYLQFQSFLSGANTIYQTETRTWAFINNADNQRVGYIKKTAKGELILISYRDTNNKDIKRIIKKALKKIK